jgi:hypothetical protein
MSDLLSKIGPTEVAALICAESSANLPKNGTPVVIDLEGGKASAQGDLTSLRKIRPERDGELAAKAAMKEFKIP